MPFVTPFLREESLTEGTIHAEIKSNIRTKNAVNVVRHRWAATSSKWISLQGQVCWTLIPRALRRIGMAIFRISLPDFSSSLLT